MALGQAPDLDVTRSRAAAIRYLSSEPGKVNAIAGAGLAQILVSTSAGLP